MVSPCPTPLVAVLLSTYNGQAYLAEQLQSFKAQTHANWVLFWRDDGSQDGSAAMVASFAAGLANATHVAEPAGHLGPTGSFMALLRAASSSELDIDAVAFADQDDVWLPEKLARGVAALRAESEARPVIYCARQILVDATLHPIGISNSLTRKPGFPASLTQNVATGCTVMLNRDAFRRVARSRPSPASLHDWWCYLLVTAAGGAFVLDDTPVVLYRQHATNFVGAPPSRWRRAVAALRRGPALFMSVLRQNLDALAQQTDLMSPDAAEQVLRLRRALQGGVMHRLGALGLPGLQRQTWAETMLFRLWFLIG